MNERDIFTAALQIADPVERAAFLDQACVNDSALRQRIDALLQAHENAGSFLKKPEVAGEATIGANDAAPANADLTEKPGTRIGPYKLLKLLGEGGMGSVYLAEQEHPVRRRVALKIIKAGMDSAQVIARFEQERQALAMMDHPNIAKVLDAGTTTDGRPFFVMELVKGIPITKFCDQEHISPQERLQLFIPVCHAVQHAHQKGVIHRDLKPSNVLIALYDGRPAPKIIDFGVAKATCQKLIERTMFTEVGAIIGTLEYMAPEQAELNNLDIDTRADIYSLGVLLYELLTGTPPFTSKQLRSAGFEEMLRMIREVEPAKPSSRLSGSGELPSIAAKRKLEPKRLTRLVHGDLDWIAMKCLEKDRARRYESASGLAADIECYLNREPVVAGPPSAAYRLKKLLQRNQGPVSAVAAMLLLLVLGTVISTWQAVRATRAEEAVSLERDIAQMERDNAQTERKTAERARDNAWQEGIRAQQAEQAEKQRSKELKEQRDHTEEALAESERNLNYSRILLAQSSWDHTGSSEVTNHYLDLIPPPFRNWEWRYLKRQSKGGLFTLHGPANPLTGVCFSPDGTRLASGLLDGAVLLWDARTGRQLLELKGNDVTASSVALSPDGRSLASGSFDGTVRIWDARTGQQLLELKGHSAVVWSVAFSPDGSQLASGSSDKTVRLWDAHTGQQLLALSKDALPVRSVAFSPDGSRLASGSIDKTVRLWDVRSGQQLLTLNSPVRAIGIAGNPLVALSFSPDGGRLASGSWDGTVLLWDARGGQQLAALSGHTGAVFSVSFSPDGSCLASGSGDNTVRLWNARTGQQLLTLKGHSGFIASVSFSPDGRRLASCSDDKTLRLWDITGQQLRALRGNAGMVQSVSFSSDGSRLASSAAEKTVRLWDARSGEQLLALNGHTALVGSVAFSPNGSRLASGSTDMTVRLWDARGGQQLLVLRGHNREISSVAFSPDGNRLASGSLDTTVRMWGTATGEQLLVLKGHTLQVISVAFSPDGSRLASGSTDKTVRLWDARTGQQLLTLNGHTALVRNVSFSPDGSRLASCSDDKTVRLWDAASGQPVLVLKGHTKGVYGVAFSPDSSRLASSSGDTTIRLWNARTGQQVLELKGHVASVRSVAFSPDGSLLASGSDDKTVRLWDASSLESLDDEHKRLLTRPDPHWHEAKNKEFEKQNNPFAAAFHRSWEQHARGVLAFEAGDFQRAYAHFVAAAALKPSASESGK
jgi:WD40 repeat protein/serine/threonine protein kinase